MVGDALSKQTLTLVEVFFADNMMASLEKEKLMTASFLGVVPSPQAMWV